MGARTVAGQVLPEVEKQDGYQYQPKTIQHYLTDLRAISEHKRRTLKFGEDVEFLPLQTLLDALYCKLHTDGVGCSVMKTGLV